MNNKTSFHWFRFAEGQQGDHEPGKLRKKFSFSSFTPLFLYHFLNKGYDMIVIKVAVYFGFFSYLSLSSFFRNRSLVAKMKEIGPIGPIVKQSQIDAMKSIHNLDSAFGNGGKWDFLGSSQGAVLLNLCLLFLVYVLINFIFGFYSRQMTWNRFTWKDMATFTKTENTWNTMGLLSLIAVTFCFLYLLVWIARIR